MSTNLYWKPVVRDGERLSDSLKFALRKRFQGGIHTTLSYSHIGYLEGLRDAGVEGAEALIEAINQHEEIQLFEE